MATSINEAYDPELFEQFTRIVGDEWAAYYRSCATQGYRTLPPLQPEKWIEIAAASLTEIPSNHSSADSFRTLIRRALDHGHRLHDPRYMGHQVPPAIPIAALFDTIAKATNQGVAVFEMGPFGIATERALVDELGTLIGWERGTFAGIATSGGTLANATALLAARNAKIPGAWTKGMSGLDRPRPAILTSEDSHYSVARAAGIMGIGTDQVLMVPVDRHHKMNVQAARSIIQQARRQNIEPFAIVGSACSTATGAFDPLHEIADLAQEENLWFHADGAHGASFLMSKKWRHLLAGMERADSVIWDAHKMLYVPSLLTFLFYRDPSQSYAPFAQDAPYLFQRDFSGNAQYDGGLRTFECTKGAIAFTLWGIWSLFGRQIFSDLVENAMTATEIFVHLIENCDDFELALHPQCNIVCFRYSGRKDGDDLSSLQVTIRERILARGNFYITATELNDEMWLRTTIINPHTSQAQFEGLVQEIRTIATAL